MILSGDDDLVKRTPRDSKARRPKPAPATPSRDRRLSGIDKAVATELASYAWGQKSECWPSISRVALKVGRCPNVVRLSIQNLVHYGYVEVEQDGSKRTGRRYRLLWKTPGFTPASPTTPSPRSRESERVNKAKAKASGVGAPLRTHRGIGAPPDVGAPLRTHGPESSNKECCGRVKEFLAVEAVEAEARSLADVIRIQAMWRALPEADLLLLQSSLHEPDPDQDQDQDHRPALAG